MNINNLTVVGTKLHPQGKGINPGAIQTYMYIYGFFPKCLFPDLIVWYFLMGARFLFNTFLMHVSHQDTMISSSSYIPEPINVACAVRF